MNATCTHEAIRVENAPACFLCGGMGQMLYHGLRDRLFGTPGVWSVRWCHICRLLEIVLVATP